MKKYIEQVNIPCKLTILSIISSLFMHESKSECGSKNYGLPAEFIQSFCTCENHAFPIDFIGLGIDLVYHFVIWFTILYLWQDMKETWTMLFVKNKAT